MPVQGGSRDSGRYGSPVSRVGGFGAAAAILGRDGARPRDPSPACERAAPVVVIEDGGPAGAGTVRGRPRCPPSRRSQRHARWGARGGAGQGRGLARRPGGGTVGCRSGARDAPRGGGAWLAPRSCVTRPLDAPRGVGAPGGRRGATASGGRREW